MTTIYNTLTRQKEPFIPIDPKNVRMYVCGMTVYDYCHLGHARVMVVFDMIARWLRECGYPLTYVRNITDIDDKIIARAAENGETIGELTARFIQAMHEDADALGVLRPDIEPKATENIPQMIAMIEALIQNGKAYPAANGDVYYAVREFAAYGQLSGKSLDDCAQASVWKWMVSNAIRLILYCGKRPKQANRHGKALGATAVRVGTSNALP